VEVVGMLVVFEASVGNDEKVSGVLANVYGRFDHNKDFYGCLCLFQIGLLLFAVFHQ
jgi:hypothetical protein